MVPTMKYICTDFQNTIKEKLTMKKKALILFLATLTTTTLLFTGCRNKEIETPPVVEETMEEIDTTELDEIMPVEEILEEDSSDFDANTGSDKISITGNDVNDEALKEEQTAENDQSSSSVDNTNNGKGYDFQGKTYATLDEYLDAIDEFMQKDGVKSPEQSRAEDEALENGFVYSD